MLGSAPNSMPSIAYYHKAVLTTKSALVKAARLDWRDHNSR